MLKFNNGQRVEDFEEKCCTFRRLTSNYDNSMSIISNKIGNILIGNNNEYYDGSGTREYYVDNEIMTALDGNSN